MEKGWFFLATLFFLSIHHISPTVPIILDYLILYKNVHVNMSLCVNIYCSFIDLQFRGLAFLTQKYLWKLLQVSGNLALIYYFK